MAKATKNKKGDAKRYRNAGVTELLIEGEVIEPGAEFEASLDVTYEQQMLMGGHLEILVDQSVKADNAAALAASEVSADPVTAEELPRTKTPRNGR